MNKISLAGIVLISSMIAVFLPSCTDLEKLSDVNTVAEFTITSHSPETIILGTPEITQSDSILIPVKYGENDFPLTINVEVRYSGHVFDVMGTDLRQPITFESMDDDSKFVVMAESGLPRTYTIKPVSSYVSVPDKLDFKVKSVSPENTVFFESALIADDVMTFYIVEPEYPVSLVAEFLHPGNFDLENFENGKTPLSFESEDDSFTLVAMDTENNTKKDITVVNSVLEQVYGTDGNEPTNLYNTEIAVGLAAGNDGFTYEGFQISNTFDSITIYLTETVDAAFPVVLNMDFSEMEANKDLIGMPENIPFGSIDEPYYFYVADLSQGIARKWKIVLNRQAPELIPGTADVNSLVYNYTAGETAGGDPCIVLDTDQVEIYPQSAEIWLKMTALDESAPDWSLTLGLLDIGLPAGADTAVSAITWEGGDTWETVKTFDVRAANGAVKTWSVRIKDYRGEYVPSSECDIKNASLVSWRPLMAIPDSEAPVTINEAEQTIYVKFTEDEGSYPLHLQLGYSLSEFAEVTSQNYNTEPLIFSEPSSTNTVTVTAEDGTSAKDYTVKLVVPEKSLLADITSFAITSYYSSVYSTERIAISTDESTGEVVISLNKSGSCPVTIGYAMTVSRKASANIALSGTLKFTNLTQVHTFRVTSMSGNYKEWKIRFDTHTPQLDNWNLNSWSDANTPTPAGVKGSPYWTTANNMFVSGTTRENGVSGYGAKLTTGIALKKYYTAGSLFLGWFNKSNILAGLIDPVILTFQGIEFSASKKIVGFEADANYTSAGSGGDTGSLAIELLKHDPSKGEFVYHGNRPSTHASPGPHPDNTAVKVARGRQLIGNKELPPVEGESVMVVNKGTWTNIRVNLDYSGMPNPLDYTHMVIIFSSSSQGDSFIADEGSVLILDNIRLIYEN